MVTVCMIACVILGFRLGGYAGYNVAFKEFTEIVGSFCDTIDHLIFGKGKRNVNDDELRTTEGKENE